MAEDDGDIPENTDETPAMPPRGLWRFLLHYSHGALPWLVALALFSGVIAVIAFS